MVRLLSIFFLLITVKAFAHPELILEGSDSIVLKTEFQAAYSLFQEEVGDIDGVITMVVNGKSCFRTGYDRVTRKIVFCNNNGLDSIDVIHHELFHAFLCRYREDLCSLTDKDYLHETLADVFAYKLLPDEDFSNLRKYRTSLNPHLVQGEHEKGNALTGKLIELHRPLKDYLTMFSDSDPIDLVEEEITGASASKLNRYRLKVDDVMTLKFSFPEEFGVFKVEWETPPGLQLERVSPLSFRMKITEIPESIKAIARFYSKDHQELGRRVYYFGKKK